MAGWVAAPGAAGGEDVVGGGLGAVAEGVGGDGSGRLEDKLAERCGAGLGGGDAEGTELLEQGTGGEGLPGAAAGEQPGAGGVGGGVSCLLARLGQDIHKSDLGRGPDRDRARSRIAWLPWQGAGTGC